MVLQWHSLKRVVVTQKPNPDVRLTLSSALKPQLSSPFQGSASALRCAKGSNTAPVWREGLCTATEELGPQPPAVYSLGREGQGAPPSALKQQISPHSNMEISSSIARLAPHFRWPWSTPQLLLLRGSGPGPPSVWVQHC